MEGGGDVNICKDHRDKIEVPDPLAVEDLISSKLNNERKLARLITQYIVILFLCLFLCFLGRYEVLTDRECLSMLLKQLNTAATC